jgi:hypothetical protein
MEDKRKQASDELIIAALASGRTATEAAAAVGVSTQTIYRRMKDPEFRAAVGRARAEVWVDDARRFREQVPRSLATLVELRDNPDAHDSTRARCAIAIVDLAAKFHELTDVAVRLAALESQLSGSVEAST